MSSTARTITQVAVVVPARDEAEGLPAALAAMTVAMGRVAVACPRQRLLIVADSCSDGTADLAKRHGPTGTQVVEVDVGNVGAARRRGFTQALRSWVDDPERCWLATTDADSAVPPDWLEAQLHLALAGWDAVAGPIAITDWTSWPPTVRHRLQAHRRAQHAPSAHGANLGCSAAAYLDAGGMPPLATSEDRALWLAIGGTGRPVCHSTAAPVITSARRHGRAPGGLAQLLTELEDLPA
ncbi:glycosyltransferase [soil metagenome]